MLRWNMSVERDGDEIQLHYGFTPSLGFSVSVARSGQLQVTYHSVVTDFTGLSGLLDALAEVGVFQRQEVQEALVATILKTPERDIDGKHVWQVMSIVQSLTLLRSESAGKSATGQ